jgi:hypothetical protein
MEDILAIIFLFGGTALVGLSFSPVGRAFADRIRGRSAAPAQDPAVYEELDHLRQEMTELQERMDFAERLLAKQRDAAQLENG